MVSVFTRSLSDDLASLVKKIDAAVEKNQSKKMAAFVVLLTDDLDTAEKQLQAFAEKHGIRHTPLTAFEGRRGPANYRLSDNAELTVLMWVNQKVEVNHAFGPRGLNRKTIKQIVDDTQKILR